MEEVDVMPLNGGAGPVRISGGARLDIFQFSEVDSAQTATPHDTIFDQIESAVGVGDLIDYSSALSTGGENSSASRTPASINQTTCVAIFVAGSGATLPDALADISTSFTSSGNFAGAFTVLRVNNAGNDNMSIADRVAGVGSSDVVWQIPGIT